MRTGFLTIIKRGHNKERGKAIIHPPILDWNQRYLHKLTVTHTNTEI